MSTSTSQSPPPQPGKYLIEDPGGAPGGGGWAMDNPIEGWCFTILRSAARRFDTFREAQAVADRWFNPGRKVPVRIIQE